MFNVAHLFSPAGNVYKQDKLHITPYERACWDIQPGESIKIFETPLAGIAGNFPKTPSYLLNYSQSAILTPSDFAFSMEATAALADPNSETAVIADMDLNALAHQREFGSVRLFRDHRPDLYELRSKMPIKIVMVE